MESDDEDDDSLFEDEERSTKREKREPTKRQRYKLWGRGRAPELSLSIPEEVQLHLEGFVVLSLDSEKDSLAEVQRIFMMDRGRSSALAYDTIFNNQLLEEHERGMRETLGAKQKFILFFCTW